LIRLVGLNLVEHVIEPIKHVSKSLVSSDILGELVPIRFVKIVIPLDTFQQHLLETFFQLEVGEMEIDKTPTQIKIQNLHIVGWI